MTRIAPHSLAGSLAMLFVFALATGCAGTSHDRLWAGLGVARPSSALLAVIDQPGPVELTTVADFIHLVKMRPRDSFLTI